MKPLEFNVLRMILLMTQEYSFCEAFEQEGFSPDVSQLQNSYDAGGGKINHKAEQALRRIYKNHIVNGFEAEILEYNSIVLPLNNITLVDQKFNDFISKMEDKTAAAMLKAVVEALPEDQRRAAIISHLPNVQEELVHLRHCSADACKYGDDNCPVLSIPEPETKFPIGYEGVYQGREFEIINKGLSGNGNEDFRMLEFKDNGEKMPIHIQAIQDDLSTPLKQWNVPILRIGYSHHMMAVSARTEEEAIERAIDEAGGEEFSEKSSEYTAPDGAMEITN